MFQNFPGIPLGYGFLGGSAVKNPPANAGDTGSIPGSGRSLGVGNGNLLQYSWLENPMDRGGSWSTVHGVAQSQIWLSYWAYSHLLDKHKINRIRMVSVTASIQTCHLNLRKQNEIQIAMEVGEPGYLRAFPLQQKETCTWAALQWNWRTGQGVPSVEPGSGSLKVGEHVH